MLSMELEEIQMFQVKDGMNMTKEMYIILSVVLVGTQKDVQILRHVIMIQTQLMTMGHVI